LWIGRCLGAARTFATEDRFLQRYQILAKTVGEQINIDLAVAGLKLSGDAASGTALFNLELKDRRTHLSLMDRQQPHHGTARRDKAVTTNNCTSIHNSRKCKRGGAPCRPTAGLSAPVPCLSNGGANSTSIVASRQPGDLP